MKQVFKANESLRRLLCALLVAIMVIGMIPLSAPKAAALTGGGKLYFQPDSKWNSAGAWFAAWIWNGSNAGQWLTMKDSDNDGIYVADIPAGTYVGVKFYRMNKDVSQPSHKNGVWNQTGDITLGNNNYFKIEVNGKNWNNPKHTDSSYSCDHSEHGKNGVCKNCDTTGDVVHNYVNGICSCGASTCAHPSHNQDGKCTNCGASVDHSYSAATCTAPKTCSVCGVTSGNPAGHNWKAATCAAPKTCSVCNETEGGLGDHSWNAATCVAPKTCSVCGATEGTAGGHSWTSATCTAPKTCSVCNETEGKALGHIISNDSCTRCGGKVLAHLDGEMNNWDRNSLPMIGTGNVCSITIELQKDDYDFKIKMGNTWYGNEGDIVDATNVPWLMESSKDVCTLKASGGTYTFTFNTNDKKLTVSRDSSSGGGGGTIDPDARLYVGTTFYDYRSDNELNGTALKDITDWFTIGKDWYIFNEFNQALSGYYSSAAPGASVNNPSKLVPVYCGHFQPEWDDPYYYYVKCGPALFGLKDGKAYRNDGDTHETNDQMYFMSVNNSIMNVRWEGNKAKPWDGQTNSASWGIVGDTLVEDEDGVGQLMAANSNVQMPFFNTDFLNKTYGDTGRTYGVIYENVQFPFTKEDPQKNGVEYWVFDSDDTTLEMKQDSATSKYYLSEVTSNKQAFENKNHQGKGTGKFGFFPFNSNSSTNTNTYNYGFGMRLEIPFNLTADGKITNKYGEKQDIIYTFSGDDDVWVFIDGVLVLDIGGSHGSVDGEINFGTMTATVSSVKASGGNISPVDEDKVAKGYQTKFTLPKDMAGEHTLTMFYMERGMWESNMSIRFNFIPASSLWAETTSFTVQKQWNVTSTDNIPASIDVQLQQRVSGATEWTNFGDSVELEQSDVSAQTTKVVWSHTWDNLPNFKEQTDNTEAALYEYRVVELAEGNKVLANGEKNNGMLVAYGEVVGSGASGYTQIISNNQVDNNVIVVIDFGLSVDATVATTDYGTLVGIGSTHKLPVGPSDYLDSTNFKNVVDGQFGTATVVTGADGIKRVRYTPNTMSMTGVDNIGFCVELADKTGSKYNYGTLTVIPAANIYYEDGFLTFKNSDKVDGNNGKWIDVADNNSHGDTQAEDRPGTATDAMKNVDADNVYGYDAAYNDCKKYSLGSAKKVTVDATTGAKDVAPKASFSFTGTGFDVVSLTDNTTGALWVEVFNKNGERVKSYIVNTYYGMTFSNGEWVVDKTITAGSNALYQIPVIKVAGLNYGSYDVTITAIYLPMMDTADNKSYSVYLDAIRIYDPANDSTSTENYVKDGESNPHLTTIKSLIIAANDFHNDGITKTMGAVFVDGKSGVVDIADYANQGPNNETYLLNGNAIAFKLGYTGTDMPVSPNNPNHYNNSDVTKSTLGIQIGAKLASGDRATMKITCGDKEKEITLTSATNMFYWLPEVTWNGTAGDYESYPIVISCSDGTGILSLTDLKLTGVFATEVKSASTASAAATVADLDADIYAISDVSVYKAAVAAMTAVPEVVVPTITGKCFTLSFEDEIRVNFYYTVSDQTYVTEQGMLVFNTDPDQVDINNAYIIYPGYTYVDSTGYCMSSTNGIAAKEMGDDRYYCAYAVLSDGTYVYSDTYQYSPKQYAVRQLENSDDENLHVLCVAMLNYGAAAQRYFGYKTDALMNAGLTAEQQALVEAYNAELFTGAVAPDEAKIGSYTATETGFGTNSVTVSFEGAFAMNFYFDPDHEDSELNFCYWTKEAYENAQMLTGENATVNTLLEADENGIFHAPISGIAAKDLDDTIYVVATYTIDGEIFCTGVIPYSISTYCKNLANGNSGELAQATAMYGFYAESYFG